MHISEDIEHYSWEDVYRLMGCDIVMDDVTESTVRIEFELL